MAYSNWGAHVWKREGPEWIRHRECEDTSVKNWLTNNPPPEDRPLERAFGMKFDVLLHATPDIDADYDFITEHCQHAVFGDSIVQVVCYKNEIPSVVINGRAVTIPDDFNPWEKSEGGDEFYDYNKASAFWQSVLPAGYDLKVQEMVSPDWGNATEVTAYLKCPDAEWLTFFGYGIGEHYWVDEEGYYLDTDTGERDVPLVRYPRVSECLALASQWIVKEVN